ncbi:MAG TPA: nucleotide exchange factor GrpE [Solirubrobacteraceae bacterium]|nr:nucleotide exchange factor GrpE [Solirubrobacteraceae bacterium]
MAAERHRDALAESEPEVEQEAPEEAPVEVPVEDGAEQAPSEPSCEPEDAEQQLMNDLEELAAKAEKADEYLLLAQRTQADFENYRKRAAREAALAQERGIAKLAKELLPAIDNLDRALKAASEEQSPLTEGIKLVHTDLLSALQRVGVEPFSPEGEPFDPQLHEAVAQQPIEGAESGTVAEVFQQGYRLGDTVLRPARVLVAA